MRHHNKNKKFGRVRKQRTALMRGLARSLILEESIKTTEAKAKALRPYVEKLVTRGKKDTIFSRRLVSSRLGNSKDAASKLFAEISPKYKDRAGGYTRITSLSKRASDGADMALIEFV